MRAALLLIYASLTAWPVQAGEPVRVTAVTDALTLRAEDGTEVRLAGIELPGPAREGDRLVARTAALLASLTKDRLVTPLDGWGAPDRRGRLVAQLTRPDGRWIQGSLLEAGFARVRTTPDHATRARRMLTVEARARRARRGLWADARYQVRDPWTAIRHLHGFEVVEGVVTDTATVRGALYLNFGPDWRDDFTIRVPPRVRRRLEGAVEAISAGSRVRARGWLFFENGPMIELSHPEQLELTD